MVLHKFLITALTYNRFSRTPILKRVLLYLVQQGQYVREKKITRGIRDHRRKCNPDTQVLGDGGPTRLGIGAMLVAAR